MTWQLSQETSVSADIWLSLCYISCVTWLGSCYICHITDSCHMTWQLSHDWEAVTWLSSCHMTLQQPHDWQLSQDLVAVTWLDSCHMTWQLSYDLAAFQWPDSCHMIWQLSLLTSPVLTAGTSLSRRLSPALVAGVPVRAPSINIFFSSQHFVKEKKNQWNCQSTHNRIVLNQ